MSLASWFRRLKLNTNQLVRQRPRPPRRLSVECLEERRLMSSSPTISYLQAPLSFQANAGQADPSAQFLSQGSGYSLALTATTATLALLPPSAPPAPGQTPPLPPPLAAPTLLNMQLVGANTSAQGTGLEEQTAEANYYLGSDPGQWHLGVANYGEVQYQGVYNGIGIAYYGNNQRQLEYNFTLAPGADAGQIQLQFTGQQSMALDAQGNLLLHTAAGDLVEQAPVAYQTIDGVCQTVSVDYVLEGNGQVGFALGSYDSSQALVIDPVLSYSAFVGSGHYYGEGIAVDSSGESYIIGYSLSYTNSQYHPYYYEAFVSKLSSAGAPLWTTLLGSGGTFGYGIAVDPSGNAYITGGTSDPSFPGTLRANSGSLDVFVSKLNSSGTLQWSTLLGGGSVDLGVGIALDATGAIYVTGRTDSVNYPDRDPSGPPIGGDTFDAFVSKLDPCGNLVWSTLVGGTNYTPSGSADFTSAGGIAVDSSGNIDVTGWTYSPTFPSNSYTFAGTQDAFVFQLDSSGTLVWSSLLGSSDGHDQAVAYGVAVDPSGNVYVTGYTTTYSFPGTAQLDTAYDDNFVSKFSASGTLLWSTLVGGGGSEISYGIAVDAFGNAYVTGYTDSFTFPGTSQTRIGTEDAFVFKLDPSGALQWSTLLGGDQNLEGVPESNTLGVGIAVDSSGGIYITGYTNIVNFSGTNPTSPGLLVAFVAKLIDQTILLTTPQITFGGSGYDSTNNAYSFIYNGQAHGASASVTGVAGADLGSASLGYYQGSYASVAALQQAIQAGTAVQLSGAPIGAGNYTVLASYAGSTGYTPAAAIAGITIAKASTAFSGLTDQQIILGTGATTVSGQLNSNTIVPVGQSIAITLDGMTQYATVAADGSFSATFATGALGVGTYNIDYSYAGDANFDAASGAGSLTVAYGTQLLFDNRKPVHAGSALPVKVALTDAAGADVSSPDTVVTATSLVGPGGVVTPKSEGNANPNDVFRYDASLGGYVFNLDTKGLISGIYTLFYMVGDDPTLHSLTFVVE
jgi:hypothetical protein